jgi:hypothetical protein
VFHQIDRFARRCVSWPLVLLGMLFTLIARELILLGAFIADLDITDDIEELH